MRVPVVGREEHSMVLQHYLGKGGQKDAAFGHGQQLVVAKDQSQAQARDDCIPLYY